MVTFPERFEDPNELYRRIIEAYLKNLRVATPGIIESFNSAAQTVTVQLAIREQVNLNGNLTWMTLPMLVDVPIVVPRAGGYLLAPAINQGDECLVIFGDNCIDSWWQSGDVQNQAEKRRHDLSDGFAILGVWSQPNVISDWPTSGIQLRNEAGTAKVEINGTTISVNTSGTVNVIGSPVNIDGSSVTIGSSTTIDDRVFMSHTHSGVRSGDSTTGGVV